MLVCMCVWLFAVPLTLIPHANKRCDAHLPGPSKLHRTTGERVFVGSSSGRSGEATRKMCTQISYQINFARITPIESTQTRQHLQQQLRAAQHGVVVLMVMMIFAVIKSTVCFASSYHPGRQALHPGPHSIMGASSQWALKLARMCSSYIKVCTVQRRTASISHAPDCICTPTRWSKRVARAVHINS